MGEQAFDSVAGDYGSRSVVQAAAAKRLLGLLDIGPKESVLDVGCGPGHITAQIADLTEGRVVGEDISGGMIEQAKHDHPSIEFMRVAAEDLDFVEEFDVVFCNSTLQWFSDGPRAVSNMCSALRGGGRMGVSCPSTPQFAPFFESVVEAVVKRPEIAPTYAHRANPWFHLLDLKAYRELFEKPGLVTELAELRHEVTEYSVDAAFWIFTTGAARGFVGYDCYDVEPPDEYIEAFNVAVREEMENRATDGRVNVDFNRLYYIGLKPQA